MTDRVKLQGEWLLRVVHVIISLTIAVGILWVRNEIQMELTHYVHREEFQRWQEEHKHSGDERMNELNRRLARIEALLDRLIETRRAAIATPERDRQ